jgi:uncharacterized protein
VPAEGPPVTDSRCSQPEGFDENDLVAGASIVGGAKLVEFLSDGSPGVSY